MNVALYHTVSAENIRELDRIVNERIDEGWELYGNPFTYGGPPESPSNAKQLVCQVLTIDVDAYAGMSAIERRKLKAIATDQKE